MTSERRRLDLRVYLVTSGTGREVASIAAACVRGGVGTVQVRAKDLDARDLLALVEDVADAVAAVDPAATVLVDDRADIAWAARARGHAVHGVHLGQSDLPVRAARALLGPDAVVGLTTGTLALAEQAREVRDVVDYVGAGPFRPTPTKDSGRPPLGLAGYAPIVAAAGVPVVAIGDVTLDDVAALAGTGVAGVCMVRALMRAHDPQAAARAACARWADGSTGRTSSTS